MRFRTKQRPRGVLRASDQRRMTLMILGCGLILVCFSIARRPAFWSNLFPEERTASVTKSQTTAPAADITAHNGIASDEFLAGTGRPVDVTVKKVPLEELPADAMRTANGLPRLPEELLKTVKDDVIGVHSTESEVYFAAMKLASKLSPAQLESAPRGAYALFMDSPNGSRGVAYRVEGKLRQLSVVRNNATAFGLGGGLMYDAWITTRDSGDKLVHVQTMMADDALGKHVGRTNRDRTVRFMDSDAPDVHFTGYFFKREGYASQQESGLSTAPLFVAGGLFEVPLPTVTHTRADDITPYVAWLALIVACSVLFMAWSFTMSDAAHSSTRAHQLTKLPAHASFEGITALTVSEALREMQTDQESPAIP